MNRLAGFVVETVIAVGVAIGVSGYGWWAPLIAFPAAMAVGGLLYRPSVPSAGERPKFDALLRLVQVGWVFTSAILCYTGFDAWWGAAVGLAVGWAISRGFSPRRWSAVG